MASAWHIVMRCRGETTFHNSLPNGMDALETTLAHDETNLGVTSVIPLCMLFYLWHDLLALSFATSCGSQWQRLGASEAMHPYRYASGGLCSPVETVEWTIFTWSANLLGCRSCLPPSLEGQAQVTTTATLYQWSDTIHDQHLLRPRAQGQLRGL